MPDAIHTALSQVAAERARRSADPVLQSHVMAVKRYQQQRFSRMYADLLADPRHAAAARFFLDELYGTRDFSQRDAQFARVVPTLRRMFPADLVGTVAQLAQLHALTEALDTAMGEQLASHEAGSAAAADGLDDMAYATAWRAVGQPDQRERQIALVLQIGVELDRLVHRRMLWTTLRLMRAPAQAAGLGQLQEFLENGFSTFKAMHGAADFLACVGQRERALCRHLFAGTQGPLPGLVAGGPSASPGPPGRGVR